MKNLVNRVLLMTMFCFSLSAAYAADSTAVLLKKGAVKITQAELLNIVNAMVPEAERTEVLSSPEQLRKLLLEIYQYRALANEAKQQKIDQDPVFAARMKFAYERSLALEYLDAYVAKAKKPSFDQAAREAYVVQKSKFMKPEEVSAEHILIKTEERTADEALALAVDIRKQALAGKKSFPELAVEYSEDLSVKNNKGSLGFFSRDKMVKEFSDAAFALSKKGEISEPVKSQFGYHIIRLVDRNSAKQLGFDEVKKQLIADEERAFLQKIRVDRVNVIKHVSGIEVDEQALKNIGNIK